MKEQIKEVENYFLEKLRTGDFEVQEIEQHDTLIEIDNEYKFKIWTANEADGVHLNNIGGGNFMNLKFSADDRRRIWDHLGPFVVNYKRNFLLEQKRKEYETLKAELKESEL